MSQLIRITFNETFQVGDDVYSEGRTLSLPAEQAFGSHASRQLAPFDLFDSGLGLVSVNPDGSYRLAYDIEITVEKRSIRQSDTFYYTLPTTQAFGWLIPSVNDDGSFTLKQSDLSVLVTNTVLNPGVINIVELQFFFKGSPVSVTGPNLAQRVNAFDLTLTAPFKPGALQYTLEFTYDGLTYEYPLSLSVLQPGLTLVNETPSLKAGELGLFKFSVTRDTGTLSYPEIKIASVAVSGGTPGALYPLDTGLWGLEITPKNVVFTMILQLVLDIDGWKVPWVTNVTVTQKAASVTVAEGDVLKLNLTQPVRLRLISDGKLVSKLTTKSLNLSGSPSYHTYSKSLVKLADGLYQFSIYTNNIQGTMYVDIVVTIDGVDLPLSRIPITVRK